MPKKKTPKRGRPVSTGPTPVRAIKVSDAQWDEWGRKAKAAGMSRSEWIRQACDAACDHHGK